MILFTKSPSKATQQNPNLCIDSYVCIWKCIKWEPAFETNRLFLFVYSNKTIKMLRFFTKPFNFEENMRSIFHKKRRFSHLLIVFSWSFTVWILHSSFDFGVWRCWGLMNAFRKKATLKVNFGQNTNFMSKKLGNLFRFLINEHIDVSFTWQHCVFCKKFAPKNWRVRKFRTFSVKSRCGRPNKNIFYGAKGDKID